ncbi:desiccation-related protein At2g46140-like [Aristolochia californica]|uniref:desiccation-related protein At2g46140-like n=1 Tax=Aristolochia californica TaxID=171875 RepID=UPI0035DFC75F
MASSDKPVEKQEGDEDKGGFLEKVKEFIHDVGEKIEETVGFGKPSASVAAVHIPSIDLKHADLVIDVLVSNPNPIPIPLVDVKYLIESDGRKLMQGLIPDAGTIHAHGTETIKVPVTLIFDDIKETYKDIKSGSVIPYKVAVELIVDLPVFGNISLPLETTGEIPVPYKPDVDLMKVKFTSFSFEETTAMLHLKVDNKNDFDLGLNALEYEMCLAGVSIGGARLSKSANIDKNGYGMIEIPITFKPKDFGSALWDMIRGKRAGYSMMGTIDVDSPFGPMNLPFKREGGQTKLKEDDDDDDDDDDDAAGTNFFH